MATLLDLPSELLEQVLLYLSQPAYHSLAQVSKPLNAIVIPHLYRDITLLSKSVDHAPRVDTLFFNILDKSALRKHVHSLRLGVKGDARCAVGGSRRSMPIVDKVQHQEKVKRATSFIYTWDHILHANDFHYVLEANDYGAYAALLFLLVLPTLQSISVADNGDETLRPLKKALESMRDGRQNGDQSSLRRLESIKEVIFNTDHETAAPYPQTHQNELWKALLFPTIEKLEVPTVNDHRRIRLPRFGPLRPLSPLTCLTSLILRYAKNVGATLHGFLPQTPQLRSLTCEACWSRDDTDSSIRQAAGPWIELDTWNAELRTVKNTLQTLVLSVEHYLPGHTFFTQQDRLLPSEVTGRLDLRGFDQLHTLEAPVPFLTGGPMILMGMDYNYLPYAPPNIHHLTLRTDMTEAQFVYPEDTGIKATGPTFAESKEESRVREGARMDLSLLFQFGLSQIDQLPYLQSFAVWQPPDPSLDFFDNQLEELRTSCKNKSITAKVIYPMLLRKSSPVHWNLVREVTLFDSKFPECGTFARLFRGERDGIPLGLAEQYHLDEFKNHRVRRSIRHR